MLAKLYSYFSPGALKEVSESPISEIPNKTESPETPESQTAQAVSNTAQLASSSSGKLRFLDRQARWLLANRLTHPRQMQNSDSQL